MKKEQQLERAKHLATVFLHLPMEKTKFSPIVVQHPFFESAFLYDRKGIFNALEEEGRYNDYRNNYAENVIGRCDTLEALLYLVRKSYRLTFLLFMSKEKNVSTKECGNLLAGQWDLIENLSNDANVKKSTVLRWVMAADKAVLMDAEEREVYAALPDVVTIYRGCRTAKAVKGMSWSLSEEKARWFAERGALLSSGKGDGALVYRAKIKKEDVVAYLDGRNEEEVIVDFRKLFDVECI